MSGDNRLNFVFILADDLGWRDLGCYGSPFYETPTLDQLAQEGARFTDAYAASPICSPTRASVMTGKYPASVGVTDWIDVSGEVHPRRGKLIDAQYTDHLPEEETTLATALNNAGYATWHVGKWHLGGNAQNSLPEDHGFDTNVAGCEWGSPSHASDGYFSPEEIPFCDMNPSDHGEYLPDYLGEQAADLIAEHAGSDEPFFLNFDPYLVHTPLQAPETDIERYEQKRRSLGLEDIKEYEIGERYPYEESKNARIKHRTVQSDPAYAAMVEALDRNVGRILDALEQAGQADNTVVVFTSDNGGFATTDGSPTTNRPLSEGKGWMNEGGNRVPMIVRWPGVTDDAADTVETPVISPDIYPTLLDAANVPIPADQDIEGESIRPLFNNEALDRDAIFWHYPHYGNQGATPSAAIREGDWKLISYFEEDYVELYHLGNDVRENHDLSQHRPQKVAALQERLTEWQNEVDAKFPTENNNFEPWTDRAGPK